jgi:spore coat protein A
MPDHDIVPASGLNRRQFFKLSAATGIVATLPDIITAPVASGAAVRILATQYADKFTKPLRLPRRIDVSGPRTSAVLDVVEFQEQILTGYPKTTVYGYAPVGQKPTLPGPTFIAESNRTVHAVFNNRLPTGDKTLAEGGHLLPVDATLLSEDMLALPAGEKPIVTHLHGSHVEWQSDGYPDAWYTQRGRRGEFWRKAQHTFDNSQVGGTLWYHDHAHGITRLNVYAGLAGMYLLRDETERELVREKVLPAEAYETELVIQDKFFTDDGQLFMDTRAEPENGIIPSIFGDFILVNGVPWPVMDVEPRKYRFRIVNASDSRIYVLALSSGDPLLVVGSELGLLPQAVPVTRLPIGPGERYDVVVDLGGAAQGTEVILRNHGVDGTLRGFRSGTTVTNRPTDDAFGFGAPINPATTGQVMKLRVSRPRSSKPDASVVAGTALGPALPTLTATKTRGVIAFNGRDNMHNRNREMLGSLEEGTMLWHEPVTERIAKGTTEIWEIYNTGPVVHPIHIHLVDFHVLDRSPFTFTSTPKEMHHGVTGAVIEVTGTGTPRPPESYEVGRKDTVLTYPGEVTRVIANFDRTGNYVWHCHLLHHEDHEMMRPFVVE